MENTRQISMRFMVLYGIFFTAWVFWAICGRQVSHAVFRFFYSSSSEEAVCETSIQFRYPEAFQKTLSRYPVFAKLYCEEDSPAVPGLAYTELEEYGCNQMVPQGICIAGEYMLISAYDNGPRAGLIRDESYVPQNSVIYILSCGRGEFLTTLILPDVNHVGGLAFDGSRVWIAKSSTGTVSVISYERIAADSPAFLCQGMTLRFPAAGQLPLLAFMTTVSGWEPTAVLGRTREALPPFPCQRRRG